MVDCRLCCFGVLIENLGLNCLVGVGSMMVLLVMGEVLLMVWVRRWSVICVYFEIFSNSVVFLFLFLDNKLCCLGEGLRCFFYYVVCDSVGMLIKEVVG